MTSFRTPKLILTAALVLLFGLQSPYAAAAGGKGAGDEEPGKEPSVAMPILIAPVMQGRRFWGHAYFAFEMTVAHEIWRVRKQVHRIQDHFVRTVYAEPFQLERIEILDERAKAREIKAYVKGLEEAARTIAGANTVDRLVIVDVGFRPL